MACVCRSEDPDTSSKLLEGPGESREAATVFLPNEEKTAPVMDAECCCTPTAKECRIPEILTCPPAPRKRRADRFSSLPSVRPREYFVPHNLDAFFTSVSVPNAKYFR